MLKVDFDSNTATAIYHQRLDAVGVKTISINEKQVSASSLLRALGDYFGTPGLTFIAAYDLNNIAILVSEEGFFIVSKKEWMSPIIGFAGGQPIANQQIPENLVRLDKGIQQNIINNILPSAEEQENNVKKWAYIFSQLTTTRDKRGNTSLVTEEGYIGKTLINGVWTGDGIGRMGLDQTGTFDNIRINKYAKDSNNVYNPVGCAPLAIARIMNYWQYPQGDVFFYSYDQYTGLNKKYITDAFALLVRRIGDVGGATYTISETGMKTDKVVPVFQQADYNAIRIKDASNTPFGDLDMRKYDMLTLYNESKTEIKKNRPAFLAMNWYSYSGNNEGAHAVVVTGYKKIGEDLYIEIALGWGAGVNQDRYLMHLDALGFWGYITTKATPGITITTWDGNFRYTLFSVSPKKTTYKLTVNNDSKGTVISSNPFGSYIYCGNYGYSCSYDFYLRSYVTLTAVPKTGYKFIGWSGACLGTSSTCSVLMNTTRNVTANFAAPPAAPEILSATAQTGKSIKISWTDKSTNENGFKVYRWDGKSSTTVVKIGSLSSNSTSYTNTGLTSGTQYCYYVAAYNDAGETKTTSYKCATAIK